MLPPVTLETGKSSAELLPNREKAAPGSADAASEKPSASPDTARPATLRASAGGAGGAGGPGEAMKQTDAASASAKSEARRRMPKAMAISRNAASN